MRRRAAARAELCMGEDFRNAQARHWEREYRTRGALWAGPSLFDFPIPAGARVLELGCGSGKTLSALLKTEAKLTAIDASPKAVSLCRKMALAKNRHDTEFLVADVCSLPFPDSAFDFIVAFHVLEHLLEADRAAAVSEIQRVLAKGGKAFVQAFSTGDMRFGKGEELEEGTFLRNGLITHYFTESELEKLFGSFRRLSISKTHKEKKYHGKELKRERIVAVFERC